MYYGYSLFDDSYIFVFLVLARSEITKKPQITNTYSYLPLPVGKPCPIGVAHISYRYIMRSGTLAVIDSLFLCIKEYLKEGERVEHAAREETSEIGSLECE